MPQHINPGDLRYNIINLIDEPLHNNLLGYGPSVIHPLTGEIIKGQVNQYAGTISKIVPRVWNDLVRFYNRRGFNVAQEAPPFVARRGQWSRSEQSVDISVVDEAPAITPQQNTQAQQQLWKPVSLEALNTLFQTPKKRTLLQSPTPLQPHSLLHASATQNERRLQHWSSQNAFAEEFIWVSSTAKAKVKGIDYQNQALYQDSEKQYLKKWHHLDPSMQAHVHRVLATHIYRSTLVHELGHDLGLRHNFKGSSDKNNFYSPQEAQKLGYEHPPAYSSIMDYAASEFDALVNFGPYDQAALRYGYKREVTYFPEGQEQGFSVNLSRMDAAFLQGDPNLEYGPLYTLDTLLGSKESSTLRLSRQDLNAYFNARELAYIQQQALSRHPFAYCTDEDVRMHSGCNRFIEGSNVYETILFREQNI